MKIIQTTAYEAFDGTHFTTEEACREYEAEAWPKRFVGLTVQQVADALNRHDIELADAFERAGLSIRALRYKLGELRRGGRGKPDEALPAELPADDPDFREVDEAPQEAAAG